MGNIHIEITHGESSIRLEGEGPLILEIFRDLRENGLGKIQNPGSGNSSEKQKATEVVKEKKLPDTKGKKSESKAKNSTKKKYQLQLDKSLDLTVSVEGKKLSDFYAEKKPSSNIENSLVFIYFLQNYLKISNITIDKIYTCYDWLKIRIPGDLKQNLNDISSSRYGYIETQNGEYTVSIKGKNFVEHELPKSE